MRVEEHIHDEEEEDFFIHRNVDGHEIQILFSESLLDEKDAVVAQCKTCNNHIYVYIRDDEQLEMVGNLVDALLQLHVDGIIDDWQDGLEFPEYKE